MKVIDIRDACCLVSAGLDKQLRQLPSGEQLEIIISTDVGEEMLTSVAKKEGCEILETKVEGETIRASVKKKWAKNMEEAKTENCMVCGSALEYLKEASEVVCNFCGKKEAAYIRCPIGHYVCEQCHGKAALDVIKEFVLTTKEEEPFSIAEVLMSHPQVPFLGCEHASITAGAFLAALRNTGNIQISDEQMNSTLIRVQEQSIAGYCALNGCCGVAIGIGAVFGTIMGATCPKDRESAITMHAFARVVEAIANDVGPMCCKSFVRTALGVGYNLTKEYLNIELPIHRNIQCLYSKQNPHGCRESKCVYFSKSNR